MTHTHSSAEFQNKVRECIRTGSLDTALSMIHEVVEHVIFEPINTARVFGSKLLDDLCQEIGADQWRKVQEDAKAKTAIRDDSDTSGYVNVYIVSKLWPSGGHTLALADIIRLGPSARSVILVTGVVGTTDRNAVQHRFDSAPDVTFEYAPRGSHLRKLEWLQKRIQSLVPASVWLFNHHQDSVAVAAVQPNAGYRLRFYHHGDHHLCLGVYLDYACHIDMHPMGFHNCRSNLGIRKNKYLPLIAKDLGGRQILAEGHQERNIITCTAASSNKIEAPYSVSYLDVVPELLRASGGKHIHIGYLSAGALRRIRRRLDKLGIQRTRFVHIPYVRSLWKTLQEHHVNLYVASFPYGGARTLIEAMGAETAVALHVHHSSRLLSTYDMAYEGALCWRTPSELFEYVGRTSNAELRRQARLARDTYVRFYREDLLAEGLSDPDSSTLVPALRSGYMADELEGALDIANQISFSGLMRRRLKRILARMKSATG